MQSMGLGKLASNDICFKRKYRWLFKITDVSYDGVNALPPSKSARPSLSFKEMDAQHLNETLYFPSKPEWKPVNLVLYDVKNNSNVDPVWDWLTKIYDPKGDENNWKPAVSGLDSFKKNCTLEMYDGCGNVMEKWKFEGAWPQNIEFGELDMSSSEVVTIDLTLRYDRAYIE